jgi:hypothetical protein
MKPPPPKKKKKNDFEIGAPTGFEHNIGGGGRGDDLSDMNLGFSFIRLFAYF